MNNEELKPCAHCGCAVDISASVEGYTIKCDDCPAGMIFRSSTEAQARAAWNRRAPASAPASAPVASIDKDAYFGKLLSRIAEFGFGGGHEEALIAHIDAWGQQQREAGLQHAIQTIKNSNDVAEDALKQRDALRERAEKAEAALAGLQSMLAGAIIPTSADLESAMQDAAIFGTGVVSWGKHVPLADIYKVAARTTSDIAYESLSPERRKKFNADMVLLDQRMQDHRRERERRQNVVPVDVEHRIGDRRHK